MKHRPIKPIEDLNWFFQDSPAALGMKAQAISDTSAIPSARRDFGPNQGMMQDANRQRRIQEEVATLSTDHKSVLEVAYELRHDFMPRGNDADAGDDTESDRERQLRLSLAEPVVRKVRLQYQDAYERADAMVRDWERDEKKAKAAKNADEIAFTKAQLSASRNLRREIKERAAAAEREGVELLRAAHKAYLAVRKEKRSERRAEAKRVRTQKEGRRKARAQEGKDLGKALSSMHDEELDAIVASLGPLISRGFSDSTARWLSAEGLA